ncbi:MAG: hypothetical protein AAF847_06855 [Bacteroidota bacterium]
MSQNKNNSKCIATDHAYERAKGRLSWKKRTLDRMMLKAYQEGKTHGQTKGKLRKYLDKLYLEHKTANNTRIYGEVIYLFSNNILVTLYRLPNNLGPYLDL